MAEPTAPNMPPDAPQDVKDFFGCKGDKLAGGKGKVEWLKLSVDNPLGEGKIELTPDVSFEHGKAAGSIDMTIDLGYGLSGTMNASINADGQLVVNDVSTALSPFKGGLNDAINNINDWFRKNGKKLKPPKLKGGALTLEKTPITPPATGKAVTPLPPPPPAKPEQPDKPKAEPVPPATTDAKSSGSGCGLLGMLMLVMLIGVMTLGGGIGYVFFGGPGVGVGPTAAPTPELTPRATVTGAPSVTTAPTPSAAPGATASPQPTATSTSGPQGYLAGICARVVHQAYGNFLSYIEWLIYWDGLDVDHFVVTVAGANNGDPVDLAFDPATAAWTGRLGLMNPGEKRIGQVIAVLDDGTSLDITADVIDILGEILSVRYPQQDSFGNSCPPA
jgi:hypothetical protein